MWLLTCLFIYLRHRMNRLLCSIILTDSKRLLNNFSAAISDDNIFGRPIATISFGVLDLSHNILE